jgi:hypothetical protein
VRGAVLHGAAARSRCQPTQKRLEKVIKSVKTVSGVLDVERVYR